jgi:hypothetical protein
MLKFLQVIHWFSVRVYLHTTIATITTIIIVGFSKSMSVLKYLICCMFK